MSIPALRPPAPALPMAVAVAGISHAAIMIVLNIFRTDPDGLQDPDNARLWALFGIGGRAATIGAYIVAAVASLSLVRSRRSAGAALTAAAFVVASLAMCVELVATWMWPWFEANQGIRADVLDVTHWTLSATAVASVAGLCMAGWADRGVRLIAPAAIGASLIVSAPPPLIDRAFGWVERETWRWSVEAGAYVQIPDARMWIVPSIMAVATLAWAAAIAVLVMRQPPIPVDTVAPRPPAPALRRFAVSLLVMAAVAVAAGITIALVQGKPADGTGPLALLIPIVVGIAAAGVAAALVNIAVTDVEPRAARFTGFAAICVLWCVAVIAAQTLASQRPRASGPMNPLLFAIFEPPWMPGMVGAAVAVLALVGIAAALTALARQAGQRPSRVHTLVILLGLAIGALTTPWVLGFGTRSLEMSSLRVATLASAAVVNLAAWIALARSAWRTAAAFDEAVTASVA